MSKKEVELKQSKKKMKNGTILTTMPKEEENEEVELESVSESTDEYDQAEEIIETVKQIKYNEILKKQIKCKEAEHEDLADKLERMKTLHHAIMDTFQKLIQKHYQAETDTKTARVNRENRLRECAAQLQVFKCQKYCDDVNVRQNLDERVNGNEALGLALKLMGMQALVDQHKYNHFQKFVTDEVGQYCQEALRVIIKQDLGAKQIFDVYKTIIPEHVEGNIVKKPCTIQRKSDHLVPDEKDVMKKVMGYFDQKMKKRKELLSVIEENEKVIQHYKNILENIKSANRGNRTKIVCKKETPMKRVNPEMKMKMVLNRENEFRCLKNEIHALEMKLIRFEQIEDYALDTMEDMKQEKENEEKNKTNEEN